MNSNVSSGNGGFGKRDEMTFDSGTDGSKNLVLTN
jgi:hypothetical protein